MILSAAALLLLLCLHTITCTVSAERRIAERRIASSPLDLFGLQHPPQKIIVTRTRQRYLSPSSTSSASIILFSLRGGAASSKAKQDLTATASTKAKAATAGVSNKPKKKKKKKKKNTDGAKRAIDDALAGKDFAQALGDAIRCVDGLVFV